MFSSKRLRHIRTSFTSSLLLPALIGSLLLSALPVSSLSAAGIPAPAEMAAAQLETMTPEEKVGQLFLVTFNGVDTSAASPIYEYISSYHIGGVVLDRDNDNFQGSSEMLRDTWSLIQGLQTIEHESSLASSQTASSDDDAASTYIPLFVAVSQEGNYSEYSEILTGLSPIPSQMSLGATWDPGLVEQIGEQVGRELASLGINLLFGPSLDVVSNPATGQSNLGVRSFGGDPFWVGKLGQSYIKGIHSGSLNNIAVVAKYFPGLGSSDRLPEQEVATVRKSLEQLKQIDLAPFFAVTGNAPSREESADALLNSHIRYQGLQGNIRSTTRPISLDPQAFELLMDLPALGGWRDAGGIIISDNLGSQALQNLYDPTGETFNIQRVAVDAFIAGNDILFLGNYGDDNKAIPNHEIAATLDFFSQKYQEDQDFADRVDRSVLRILTLKYSLYPNFNISTVLPSENSLTAVGNGNAANIVARESATLINPGIAELTEILQPAPSSADRIVILTDTDRMTICSDCPELNTLETNTLENAIVRLYGPFSGRLLYRANITSYSFRELSTLLDFPDEAEQMVADLYNANWIIIATLEQDDSRPYSTAFTRLLAERQDLLRDKRIIVFALGAPYYLDATNISKISAFFALYNHLPSSIDVAARILFNEFPTFPGSLPVSVPGINYDLISATSPDPSAPFTIYVGQLPNGEIETQAPGVTPTAPVYRIEDQVDLYTDVILDHNGNPVPDGTPVTFYITSQGATTALPQVTTKDGSASTSFFVESRNNISIHAESSQARSQTVDISVFGDELGSGEATPVESPAATPLSTETVEPTLLPGETPEAPSGDRPVLWRTWFVSLLIVGGIGFIAYRAGARSGSVLWGIRMSLASVIAGLALYNYLLLGLPGSDRVFPDGPDSFLLWFLVIVGSVLGWLMALLLRRLSETRT